MTVAAGTRFGPYEIISPIGAGGMGEVYRARDTRLDRTVAIKILPPHLASSADFRERFEREARAISALNHPNICVLHDIGRDDAAGFDYLILEFLDGESLAERLVKGALPLNQVLRYGAEIADALDKAHRAGIVHRDLKPGNVMLTKAGAKLLDFGLAKPAAPSGAHPPLAAAMTAATFYKPLTGEGTIVGTFQYMSPEQLQGQEADARSDIFALGCVLYEMATGTRAFPGKSQISVMSAILEKEPMPISSVQPLTPPALEYVVRTCLAKDPADRWQSARDVHSTLQWLTGPQSGAMPAVARRRGPRRERVVWMAVCALLLFMAVAAGLLARRASSAPEQLVRFTVSAPEDKFLGVGLALSPDAKQLVFVAEKGVEAALVLRSLDSLQDRSLDGTDRAHQPFWSPDGRSIGFFAEGKLKKIELASGAVQNLADTSDARGGTWSQSGILYGPNPNSGLWLIPASGGAPVEVTKIEHSKETSHRWPTFLPDGRHFVYCSRRGVGTACVLTLASLDGMKPVEMLTADSSAIYAEPGYLLFVHGRTLLAHAFDARTLKLSGDTIAVAEGIEAEGEAGPTSFVNLTAARNVLAYRRSTVWQMQLQWFSRDGKLLGPATPEGSYDEPLLSPDGRFLAVDRIDESSRRNMIWVLDLERDAFTRVSHGAFGSGSPIWSPDGKQLYFGEGANDGKDSFKVVRVAANGTGQEEVLVAAKGRFFPDDVSRDGRYLLYEGAENGPPGLWVLSLADGKVEKFLDSSAPEIQGSFSPDGHWIVYTSLEAGDPQVYALSFPDKRSKVQISTEGGGEPQWSRDGKEIFYLGSDVRLRSVAVQPGDDLHPGRPQLLAADWTVPVSRRLAATGSHTEYSTRDGKRFLVNATRTAAFKDATVVVNWAAALNK